MPKKGQPSPQKGRLYGKEVYDRDEIFSLLAQTSSTAPTAVRNRALIVLLWQSGLRLKEALDLMPSDVNKVGQIHVRHGKGNKERRVHAGRDVVPMLDIWMAVRSQRGISMAAPLFCTLNGSRLSDKYVRNMLRRLAAKAEWMKRIHPHGFRHTFAATLTANNVSMKFIQEQLGHTSLNTTSIYLEGISKEHLAEAMQKVEW